VLVSREWSGKPLSEHRADRATVVHEALLSAGMIGNREFGDCRNVWSVAARGVWRWCAFRVGRRKMLTRANASLERRRKIAG